MLGDRCMLVLLPRKSMLGSMLVGMSLGVATARAPSISDRLNAIMHMMRVG